ncbi:MULTISPECIES: hypothetical protein [Bradyrhizobium]|uniref:Uncharacterized protein n=2 Tax=Bradyrhizobium TaxID=374 RepID=A0ABY0PK01_9BRAD|nr:MULTISPECIES: hypothetical protein [Bradyrhizobium]SDI54463.1 hypothetical protein SAMN05444163_3086 [Bradyrhizobium ottawaense]SED43012.1 hypothetical protein SAMN05444171_4083 [Bradyrhizobium lablabi]
MATNIVGSKEKSQTGRGQNQDQTPVTTSKKLAAIPKVSPPNASADAGDWQTRKISGKAINTHSGMLANRPGHDGKVPPTTSSRRR